MGQYFKCVNLDKKEWIEPDSYRKLTENAWIGNDFVETVESMLGDEWRGDRIVWVGDYIEKGLFLPDGATKDIRLYDYARRNFTKLSVKMNYRTYRYLVNTELKQYVDKKKVCENDGWAVHPLPILTASGNGQGGGDYRPNNNHDADFVGIWAGSRIYASDTPPDGYEEIVPDFY